MAQIQKFWMVWGINQKPIQFVLRPFAVLGFGVWFVLVYLIA